MVMMYVNNGKQKKVLANPEVKAMNKALACHLPLAIIKPCVILLEQVSEFSAVSLGTLFLSYLPAGA